MQLTIVPSRHIGPFFAQATLEERHRDQLHITRHPVETGAQISDHAYKVPSEVVITASWSNGDPANDDFDENYVRDLYDRFIKFQATFERFTIITGKRTYRDMLVEEVETTTTKETETTLVLRVTCRQLIIVGTQVVSVPPEAQADPTKTQAITNTGPQQLRPSTTRPEPPT